MLGLLALLAVAGAFLILGLLSGYLRLSERVAEAEMVKTVADGLDSGLKIVNQQGVVLYRNRALQRLTGRRAGRHATLEELFAGEPDSAQAFFRLNRAAERGEAARRGVLRSRPFRRRTRRPLAAGGGAALSRARAHRYGGTASDAVAGCGRHPRAHARDRDGERAGVDAGLLRQSSAGAVRRGSRRARSRTSTRRCRNGCACAPSPAATLTLLDIVPADGADLIRAVARSAQGRTTRLELDLLREDGRTFPAQLVCRGHGPRGIISVLVLDRSEEPTRAEAHAHTEMRLTRVFQSAPFGIATADAGGRIVTANCGVHAHVRGGRPRRADDGGRPRARRRGSRSAASLPRRWSGRSRAARVPRPSRSPSGPSASWRGAST